MLRGSSQARLEDAAAAATVVVVRVAQGLQLMHLRMRLQAQAVRLLGPQEALPKYAPFQLELS